MRRFLPLSLAVLVSAAPPQPDTDTPLIRRTEFGVPHITATNFRGIGIGLGYAQTEDYGERVVLGLLRDKAWMGRTFGKDSVGSDFAAQLVQQRVQDTYHLLDADTRAMYEGFAEGVNRYIRAHGNTLPSWATPVFTGHDVAAGDIGTANITTAQRLVLRRLQTDSLRRSGARDESREPEPAYNEDGSNAWALAPSRTTSGRAILLRNPHWHGRQAIGKHTSPFPGNSISTATSALAARLPLWLDSIKIWAGPRPTTRRTWTKSTRLSWTHQRWITIASMGRPYPYARAA